MTPTIEQPMHTDVRAELRIALERLRDDHQNGDVDQSAVIEWLRDWRPDLPAGELCALWQHIEVAFQRLEHLASDMLCPSEGDPQSLEQEWTDSLETGIDRLMGVWS